jgi:hypothetical protein
LVHAHAGFTGQVAQRVVDVAVVVRIGAGHHRLRQPVAGVVAEGVRLVSHEMHQTFAVILAFLPT